MSEIQRYHFPDYDYEQPFVTEADHEAAVEQVLADATARIEGLKLDTGGFVADLRGTHNAAIDQALAALNQPQTEKDCPECDGSGEEENVDDYSDPRTCPSCSGTGKGNK